MEREPTEMEVRVAKAICQGYWKEQTKGDREAYYEKARDAIRAIYEPTLSMLRAGFKASPHDVGGCRDQIDTDSDWLRYAVLDPFQAMIDAASPPID